MIYSNNNNEIFLHINRKMKYGAPELKVLYQKFVIRGLIASVVLVTLLSVSSLAYLLKGQQDDMVEKIIPDRKYDLSDLKLTSPADEKQIELPKKILLKDLSALAPEPVARKFLTEETVLKNQRELEGVKLPVSSEGSDDLSKVTDPESGTIEPTKIDNNIEIKDEATRKDFKQFEVEKAPVAINLNSVKGSMRYPKNALLTETEGRVVVRVLVGTNGNVLKVIGISGPEVFWDEVKDKVMNLQFSPALHEGQFVKCQVSVPFSFTLKYRDRVKDEH